MYIATSTMFHIECTANTLLNTHLYALFTSQVLHIKPKKEQLEKLFEPIFQLLALIPYNKSMQQLDCYQAWCHLTQKVYYPLKLVSIFTLILYVPLLLSPEASNIYNCLSL